MLTFSNWVVFISVIILGVFGVLSLYTLMIKGKKRLAYFVGIIGLSLLVVFQFKVRTSDIKVKDDVVSVPCSTILVTQAGEYKTQSEDTYIDDLLNDKSVREVIQARVGNISKTAVIEIKSEEVKIGLPTFIRCMNANTNKGLFKTSAEIV